MAAIWTKKAMTDYEKQVARLERRNDRALLLIGMILGAIATLLTLLLLTFG